MRRLYLVLFTLCCCCAAQSLTHTYNQVVTPSINVNLVAATENVSFRRDALQFQLRSGHIALTQAINGHVTAAVFSGDGTLAVDPPMEIERRQVALFTGEPRVNLRFSQAVFRFGDATRLLTALGDNVTFKPQADTFTPILLERQKYIAEEGLPDGARVLQALYSPNPVTNGLFLADLKTEHHDWVQAEFDPLQLEPVSVHAVTQSAKTGLATFDDIWTQFGSSFDLSSGIQPAEKHPEDYNLDDYVIDIEVPGNLDMQATAKFNLLPGQAAGQGVFLGFDSNLRVTAAHTADGKPIGFLQPRDPKRVRPPRYFGDWLYLQLPATPAAEDKLGVVLTYNGKHVIEKVGDGNFFCRSMGWYPFYLLGAAVHRANFDLTFRVEKKNSVIATGIKVKDEVVEKQHVEQWHSEVPLTVAGFAMGEYKERQAQIQLPGNGKTTVEVFANAQPDDVMKAIANIGDEMRPMQESQVLLPPGLQNMNAVSMAPTVLQEVSNSVKFLSYYFGDYPYSKLSVTNIFGGYGQGWPSLLYLSSLSFLDQTQLHGLGFELKEQRLISDIFRAHETSHQWWGHVVAWSTSHDQWLSEGFADGSALLYQQMRFGNKNAVDTLRQWRRDLYQRDTYGYVPEQLGPLWLGQRLASSHDPQGYERVVYDKGGYVLYMLREMLLDPQSKEPDRAFIDMMHDFTRSFNNRSASTEDFKMVVERHMKPSMDLDHNGRMNWFFNQYVYGIGLPQVQFSAAVAPLNGGKYDLALTFHQTPGNWKMLLPVYVHQDETHYARALFPVVEPQQTYHVTLGFKPSRVTANEDEDMLVAVRQ